MNAILSPRPARGRQRGASLIEVMIAVLVMAIGLLGVAAMQTAALRNSQSSLERSQAVISTYTVLDAMRANRQVALDGGYNTGGFICSASGTASLAEVDKAAWLNGWRTALGVTGTDESACGSISCASGICEIQLRWDDSRATDAGDGAKAQSSDEQTFRTKVQL